jgi:hypothetical protein
MNKKTTELDRVVNDSIRSIREARDNGGMFGEALAVGRAYLDIKSALLDQMKFVVALAGQANGFKVDKKDYTEEQIKTCAIDALVAGVKLVGNQFNIIGGNMYITQNGWREKLLRLDGFSFADVPRFSPPRQENGTTVVSCTQEYVYGSDEVKTFKYEAMIRTNSGATIDNIIGKAKAKVWHALHDKLANEFSPYGDDDADSPTTASGHAKRNLTIAAIAPDTKPANGAMFHDPVDTAAITK